MESSYAEGRRKLKIKIIESKQYKGEIKRNIEVATTVGIKTIYRKSKNNVKDIKRIKKKDKNR